MHKKPAPTCRVAVTLRGKRVIEGDYYAWQEQAVFELDQPLVLPVPAPDWLVVMDVVVTIDPLPVPRPWWRRLFDSARTWQRKGPRE